MTVNDKFNTSFRCFYSCDGDVNTTTHYNPAFALSDIPRWLDAYKFTHPNCTSISVKVLFTNPCEANSDGDED